MGHHFLESVAQALAARDVATFRYQFPYMERKTSRPDPPDVAEATVRAAVLAAAKEFPAVPLLAGGKSFGGRMTSGAAAREPLPGVVGLVFLGFPLHAPKHPATVRASHLAQVPHPMLFLQGTRDDLAELSLITEVCRKLGPKTTLHVVEGANHSFDVPKRAGRKTDTAMDELADTITGWTQGLLAAAP